MFSKIKANFDKNLWLIIFLVGVYIALQLSADVAASKLVQIGKWSMPAGTFIFALTFTWRDLMHRKLGKKATYAAIFVAAIANVLMVLYFLFTFILPPAGYWQLQESYIAILGVVPRITIASITAELISESVDTEVYARFTEFTGDKMPWLRVLVSNAVSLPLDSVVFAVIAFAGTLPWSAIVDLMLGQIIFKAIVTVISIPIIYLWNKK